MQSIRKEFEGLRADDVKHIGQKLGLKRLPTRKADLIDTVLQYIVTHLGDYINALSEDERIYLAEAVYNGGRADPWVYFAKYGRGNPLAGKYTSVDDCSVLRPMFEVLDDHRPTVPAELIDHLRPLLPEPPEIKVETVSEIPSHLHLDLPEWRRDPRDRPIQLYESEKAVFPELRRILALVQTSSLAVSNKGRRPTAATIKRIDDALVTPDFVMDMPEEARDQWYEEGGPVRAHAWPVLLQQCGWARVRSGRLVLSSEGKSLLRDLDATSFAAGIEKFWLDDKFDELNRITNLRGQTGKGKRHLTDSGQRKRRIRDGMKKWPIGEWLTVEEAYRLICGYGRAFKVSTWLYSLYFSEQRYGHIGGCSDGLNRQYLRVLFLESLATLGLLDVAYTYPHGLWPELGGGWGVDDLSFCGRYDGLLYVRVNALGAYCLGLRKEYETPASELRGLFKVLPNYDLTITGSREIPLADRSVLESFAIQTGDQTWKIDAVRILEFVEAGGTTAEVKEFLQTNAANDVPDTVARFLNDIEAKRTAVRSVEDAVLVEIVDKATAVLIASDTRAGKACIRAGANQLAVPKKNLKAFRTALKKMGYVLPH